MKRTQLIDLIEVAKLLGHSLILSRLKAYVGLEKSGECRQNGMMACSSAVKYTDESVNPTIFKQMMID